MDPELLEREVHLQVGSSRDLLSSTLWSLGNHLEATSSRRVKIALPWKIGCGLAGGDWNDYSLVIQSFSETSLYHL